jgi:tRNA nucleotidyltransferase/poly(A) polymerase
VSDDRLVKLLGLDSGPNAGVLAALDGDGEEARVVGGAVRNALLGVAPGDIDIATTAAPDEVIRRAAAAGFRPVETGKEHGTITVVADGVPFEVTTLRQDVETYGRRAKVMFGRDWRLDAQRRDFTINALFVSRDGTLHDYVGGLTDLKQRRVRFIGDPATRIAEDYLRILRFFRFHATYAESAFDAAGLAACIRARAQLETLSRERVRMELMKLLIAPGTAPTCAAMMDAGILGPVLGGVPLLASLRRMTAIERAAGLAPDACRRLGALGVRIVEDAERLSQRLRLSNAETERLLAMGEAWRRISPADEQAMRALLYRISEEQFRDRVSLAWSRACAGVTDPDWLQALQLPERWTKPTFCLKAADFIARGLVPGPRLGKALAAAEEAWVAANFPLDQATLAAIADVAVRDSE